MVDFGELMLRSYELMRDNDPLREHYQRRFRHLLVDEFQDTNRLQCELIDLLSTGVRDCERFFVGDEFQSIYGFRHADVGVFRERRDAAPGTLAPSASAAPSGSPKLLYRQ